MHDAQELKGEPSQHRLLPYLTVIAGSNVGEMYRIDRPETVIGRGSNATLRLNDDGISRQHARILVLDAGVVVEDMGSANGSTVNGAPIRRQALRDGDKLRLGATTVLKFSFSDQLEEQFQKQMYDAALRDALTKTYNKKYFIDRLDSEFAFARRHKTMLSLLMLDIDFFKKVNDGYGHLAGDAVLARFARIIMSTIRTEDIVARYGGEEFGVICRGVSLENAGVLAERLRQLVEQTPFEFERTQLNVTTSIGVAAFPELPFETARQLIAAADEALYEAKRTGRNRVLMKKNMAQ